MSTSPGLLDRLSAASTWSPRMVCVVSLSLVFLCGGVAGAIVMDLGVHNRQRTPSYETAQGQTLHVERLQKELDLTPAQTEQVKSILNDFWQYYRTVLSEGKTRIDQVLTSEQRVKFERLLQEQKK